MNLAGRMNSGTRAIAAIVSCQDSETMAMTMTIRPMTLLTALEMTEKQVVGWAWPNRGWMDGEVLQNFINKAVGNRPLETLPRRVAIVAADLKTGEPVLFGSGNTGMAVRASAAVPGVFQPVSIGGHEYVDGGLVSPIPVRYARQLGATFVIAVDISSRPIDGATESTLDILMQTFTIMGKTIGQYETAEADVVIKPVISGIPATDLTGRHRAVLEGEKAAALVMADLKNKLERKRNGGNGANSGQGVPTNR